MLHPPSIRIFDEQDAFVFANPAAVRGPGAEIPGTDGLALAPRVAAVIGADGRSCRVHDPRGVAGSGRRPPKDRDFALGLGPVAVTAETFEPDACTQLIRVDGLERVRQLSPAFDWHEAVGLAADRTKLYAGDLVAGPSCGVVEPIAPGVTRSGRRRRDRRTRRHRSLGSSCACELVVDWDGTVTEVDGLHLVLSEFGDVDVYARRRSGSGAA